MIPYLLIIPNINVSEGPALIVCTAWPHVPIGSVSCLRDTQYPGFCSNCGLVFKISWPIGKILTCSDPVGCLSHHLPFVNLPKRIKSVLRRPSAKNSLPHSSSSSSSVSSLPSSAYILED